MSKLVNLSVLDAKNVICVWREDEVNADCDCGIALDNAERYFMVPRYVAVGLFSDGTTKSAGLHDLNVFNEEDGNIFLYGEFLHVVDTLYAKAFVRGGISFGAYKYEADAKPFILENLQKSGVIITESAKTYLMDR